MRVFLKQGAGRIFGTKKKEATGGSEYLMRTFTIYTSCQYYYRGQIRESDRTSRRKIQIRNHVHILEEN
jgi:hypothetical protein